LFVVGLGCDVLPGGITGVTPFQISKMIDTMSTDNIDDDDHGHHDEDGYDDKYDFDCKFNDGYSYDDYKDYDEDW
jgi:hypothetical protein